MKRLSPREYQVATMIGQGYRNREMAERLGLTNHSIKIYASKVATKLDMPLNRVKLGIAMNCSLFLIGLFELGLVPPDCPTKLPPHKEPTNV